MTVLAVPIFMLAGSRVLWPGFWVNCLVSVTLGVVIFFWSLPGTLGEALAGGDLFSFTVALGINLLSFLSYDALSRRTRAREMNPRQIFAKGYGPEGKLAFWERPWPWWERAKADLDDPGTIDARRALHPQEVTRR